MARLENVTADELRSYLEIVDKRRPTLRLVVGINYKEGISQTDLAEWYGVSRTTIHNWLTRLERLQTEPFEEVIYDAERTGRPSKLTDEQWDELVTMLQQPPKAAGVDAPHWSLSRVQLLVRERFDVEYSRRHIRKLLNETGLTWKTTASEYAAGPGRARQAFKERIEKTGSTE